MAKNYSLIPEAVTMYTKTESLKEVKDMSKNLVTGEFEYRGGGKGKKKCLIALGVAVGVLAVCLVAVSIVREVQLARLRRELDQLTANMIAVTANVKSLNQRLATNRLFNEIRASEDTIYADGEDSLGSVTHDTDSHTSDSLGKLHELTVLGDEDMEDDGDMYDEDDDEESGYWYTDYDRKREKTGTTNMVHLKPEDFMGSVVTLGEERPPSNIREIKRLLNQNPEDHDLKVHGEATDTADPMPEDPERAKRSVFPDSSANAAVETDNQTPKTSVKTDDRRVPRKFSSSVEPSVRTFNTPLRTVSRTVRDSAVEGPRRPFVAAHFHGNTSQLNPDIHEHYKGNGLVRVAHEAAHNVWSPAPWTAASPHPRPTLTRAGHVHVHHTGVYLVYVQIYYLDTHDIISWVLHRTNAEVEGRETLLQCAQSSHSSERLEKPNSCFSAAALFLKAGDRLAVRNTGGDRHSIMEPEKSFIGLVKLADAEDPNGEL